MSPLFNSLSNWIIHSISQTGYWAVFILMTLESALIPLPSEITMPFAGFLVGQGWLNFWLVVLMGSGGNLAGSLIAYALGFWGEKKLVRRLVEKYGRFLFITNEEVERAERWFRERGEWIAFLSRLLPVVRTFISLPAGFAKMDVFKFSLYTFFGSFIWSGILTYLGVILGENWSSLEGYFQRFDILIIAALLSTGLLFIYRKRRTTPTTRP